MTSGGQSQPAPSWIDWGVATLALPGESESGDLHLVQPFSNGVLVAVVDGLGHGSEASVAARLAVAKMKERADEPVIALLKHCHEALRKTRGAAMSLASFNTEFNTMTWVGVGNVEGVLLRGDAQAVPVRETILLVGGVVGYNLPGLRAAVIAVSKGDTLILTTDGIRSGAAEEAVPGDAPQRLAERICDKYSKGSDDALVLVARYLGGGP